MSQMTQAGIIPEWTLGWRMQRALAHAGMSVEQMGEELGVSRSTISRWLNDRGAAPRIGYLRLWALRTGVPLEWLVSGALRRAQINALIKGSSRFAPRFEGVPAGQLGLAA